MTRRVGILAIQGDVEAHARAIERLGATPCPVLREKDLSEVDALVLPGGESTTIAMGLDRLGLFAPIEAFGRAGRPILGTCAGAILLSRRCENQPVPTLGLLDVQVERNAYGTQLDSFSAPADACPAGTRGTWLGADELRCIFIRAPRFGVLGASVEVLARVDGAPVWIRQGAVHACTFHPELAENSPVHREFLGLHPPGS